MERFGVGRIPQEGAFPAHLDQVLVFELFQVVRSVELGMSSSAPISSTTKPSGCAESSSRMMRSRGSVPIAENMRVGQELCTRDLTWDQQRKRCPNEISRLNATMLEERLKEPVFGFYPGTFLKARN